MSDVSRGVIGALATIGLLTALLGTGCATVGNGVVDPAERSVLNAAGHNAGDILAGIIGTAGDKLAGYAEEVTITDSTGHVLVPPFVVDERLTRRRVVESFEGATARTNGWSGILERLAELQAGLAVTNGGSVELLREVVK